MLRQFVQVLFICLTSLIGLYIVIDAFSHLDHFIDYSAKHGSLIKIMGTYYAYRGIAFFDRTSGVLTLIAVMFTIFGGIAILLASVGLYGVISFAVNQRTQEFGIRMALGADHKMILSMVLKQGAWQLALGLSLGLGIAILASVFGEQGIRTILFDTDPRDPLIYAAVAALLALVALGATLVPARRATRVDPMIALRAE